MNTFHKDTQIRTDCFVICIYDSPIENIGFEFSVKVIFVYPFGDTFVWHHILISEVFENQYLLMAHQLTLPEPRVLGIGKGRCDIAFHLESFANNP